MDMANNAFKVEVEGDLMDGSGSPISSPVGLIYGSGITFLLELVPLSWV